MIGLTNQRAPILLNWFRCGPNPRQVNQDFKQNLLKICWRYKEKSRFPLRHETVRMMQVGSFWGHIPLIWQQLAWERSQESWRGERRENWEMKTSFQHLNPSVSDTLHTMSQYSPILGWLFLPLQPLRMQMGMTDSAGLRWDFSPAPTDWILKTSLMKTTKKTKKQKSGNNQQIGSRGSS